MSFMTVLHRRYAEPNRSAFRSRTVAGALRELPMKSHDQEMNKQGGGKGSEMEHLYPHENAEDMEAKKRKLRDHRGFEKIEEEDGGNIKEEDRGAKPR